jgi:hypothetical protein
MNKINDISKKWLTDNYGDLERYKIDKYPNHIFYMKDGVVIFNYNQKNGDCNVSYDEIWSFFESIFQLEYKEIQDITREWVEEHYKLEVTTTQKSISFFQSLVEEHYKLEVTTTNDA